MSLEFKTIKISHFVDDMKNGGTPRRNVSKYWENGTIPWLKTGEINNSPILDNSEYITEEGLKKSSAKVLPINSVIMALYGKGTAGRVGLLKFEATTNQACCAMICKDRIKSEYLYYYLLSIQPQIELLANGSVQQNLSKEILADYDINVPKNYQDLKNIVWILKNIDQKIENNKSINKNLEQLLHTIFNYWFISFDKFKNAPFKESPLGNIPEGWSCGALRDLLTLNKNPIKADKTNGLFYLPIDIIPMNSLGISELKSDEEANSSLITFNKNDILIGAMRVYFHRVVISPCSGVTRSTCFVLKPKNEHHLSYLLLLCNLDRTIQYAQNTSKGTTMPYAVWDNGLGDMDIIIPPEDILSEFHELVFPIIENIRDSYLEINKLSKLRDTLLPKLMSGEIDVSKINCDLKIIIRKIYIKSSKLFLWRYLSENKNYIKNTKSNETLLKSRTIYQINKFLAKFNARYRYYRQ